MTSIGDYAFSNCCSLTSTTIPASVTSMGNYAFEGCTGELTVNCNIPSAYLAYGAVGGYYKSKFIKVTVGENVTSIGDNAFGSCSSLTSITIPESVTSIGMGAFYNTAWYNNQPDGVVYAGKVLYKYKGTMPENTSIKVKKGTKGIAGGAFSDCNSLTSITIPESVTSIGDYAFYGCTGELIVNCNIPSTSTSSDGAFYGSQITKVTIGKAVMSIGDNVFKNFTSLKEVIIEDGSETLSIGSNSDTGLFHDCSLETVYLGRNLSYKSSPFYDKTKLMTLTIGKNVTSIGNTAFSGCSGLTSITIPESVTSIGRYAFFDCSGLTSITIPESVMSIGPGAFHSCDALVRLTIPKNVTSIGESAFFCCYNLTSITIPEGVTSIGGYAFYKCINLTTITIPEGVTSIGESAFHGCRSLTSITCKAVTPPSTIGDYELFYDVDKAIPVYVPAGSESAYQSAEYWHEFTNIQAIVPEVASGICGDNLTWKLTEEDELVIEGTGAMYNYSSSEDVPWYEYRTSIQSVSIGEGVVSIGDYAFRDCTNLTSIFCWAVNPPQMNSSFDYGVYIYVPKAALSAYKTDSMWSSYSEYIKISGDIDTGDVTYLIVNPSFEGSQYNCDNGTGNGDLNSPEGWQVTYTNADWGWKNFRLVTDGNEQDGAQYFEFWGATYHDLDLSQKLYNLPAGEYTLTAAMRTERADQVTDQHIYAKTDDVEYSSATLGAPIGSVWNSVYAWQTLTVKFTLDSESAVVIGAASSGGANSAGWFQIDNFRLTYRNVAVTDIQLNQTTATLTEGETLTLTATVVPDNATDKTVTWSSSNTAVATVDSNGKVTAKNEGVATITAKAGEKNATCVVTVEKKEELLPAVPDGEYYLYHAESKSFLSRGEYWGTNATVDRYGIPFVWTAEEYSLKFLDSNVCLFETDDSSVYTDNASTGFVFEQTEGGYLLKSQKSGRYLTIVDAVYNHQMVNVTDDDALATVWQLKSKAEHDAIVASYVEENYANVVTAAGISATAADFLSYLDACTAVDKTSAIGTARFEGNAGSWSFAEVRHQNGQPAYGTDYCELWQATGSYTQTISGLDEGIYKVTMQGFERSGGWAHCNALGDKGYEITTATLSANGEEMNLKSWYSGKSGDNNPDNTGDAVVKFNEGQYMNVLYTYVGEDGTLTLKVCKPSHVGDNWVLFNNFTLTYYDEVIAVSDITLSQTSATLTEGETLPLTATVAPDNATDKTVTWSSSNTTVATVDSNGKVTAKNEGVATITATAGNKSVTCRIEVIISNDIDQLEKEYKGLVIYDLQGRRILDTDNLKGFYIVNKRKVLVK